MAEALRIVKHTIPRKMKKFQLSPRTFSGRKSELDDAPVTGGVGNFSLKRACEAIEDFKAQPIGRIRVKIRGKSSAIILNRQEKPAFHTASFQGN
jgi:hypothetical protein